MRAGWMHRLFLAAALGLGLAACQAEVAPSQDQAAITAPAEEELKPAPPPPSSEPLPPPPPPAPIDQMPQQAPSADTGAGEVEGRAQPRIRGRMSEDASDEQATARDRSFAGPGPSMPTDGPSGIDPNRVMTPVLVELLPQEARQPRQGGSAVVLLAWTGTAMDQRRNMALCRELFLRFDQATTGEVSVGLRRDAEGETQLLRPLYWPTRAALGPSTGADRCAQRLETYDFPRAERIRRKFGLSASGPYLVVERADMTSTERVAAVIDLSRARPEDIAGVVGYFRNSFMQSGDVWDRGRFDTVRTRQEMRESLGAEVARSLLPTLVRTTRNVGCALTSLIDACEGTAPAQ